MAARKARKKHPESRAKRSRASVAGHRRHNARKEHSKLSRTRSGLVKSPRKRRSEKNKAEHRAKRKTGARKARKSPARRRSR